MFRPAFQHMREISQNNKKNNEGKNRSASGLEERYRQTVLLHAQGLHLSSALFSLDEIIEPPILIAPPPRIIPGTSSVAEDIITTTLPYLPAWPELAAVFHAPTLTLAQALSGNSDIVLTGQAGMGKTVALAYLASRLARRDPEPGLPQDTVPFLIHVADLDLSIKKDDPLKSVIDLIGEKAPIFDLARIPDFVQKTFSDGRALLLLDGTDEISPDGLISVVDFIKGIKRTFPQTRMITTASIEYLNGLVTLNFIPFALASWSGIQRSKFVEKWGDLWTNFVFDNNKNNSREQPDPLLLNGWLEAEKGDITPLELTLKTWGAYAGDICGNRPLDAIESHLRRLSPINTPREALEMLAMQVSLSVEPIFDPRKAREWVKSFEPPEQFASFEDTADSNEKKSGKNQVPSLGLISKMVESGLLTQHRNNRMRFIHPIFHGYLSGNALAKYKAESLLDQPNWIGKFLTLSYLAAFGDVSSLVEQLLSKMDRPLSRNLLLAARWLRDAPRQLKWRGLVMLKLVELLRQNGQPLGLRGQALCAFIKSEDPSIPALFRQLLEEDDYELQQLVALGSGAIRDIKSIELLSYLLRSLSSNTRSAACLSLVAIGTPSAMDTVASALLHGDENLRRAAAEALANNSEEGHAMLKEGAQMKDDLLVRRSAVYGLGRISAPWAEMLIDDLQKEDDQWAVRNAALEAIESRQITNPHIPQRLPPATESPWLIAFASKQGLGLSPDKPPTDILLQALKSGSEEERLASLAYLRTMPVEGVFGVLYQSLYGSDSIIREAVFQTISEMAARGVDVPDPIQFGVGY